MVNNDIVKEEQAPWRVIGDPNGEYVTLETLGIDIIREQYGFMKQFGNYTEPDNTLSGSSITAFERSPPNQVLRS